MPLATLRRTHPTSPAKACARCSRHAFTQPITPTRALHPIVQAKLRIGAPNDKYEQEADQIARAVMRMPSPGASRPSMSSDAPATSLTMSGAPLAIEGGIHSLHGRGRPLAQPLRDFFAPRFGHDISGVRVHTDARAAELAGAIQARAFAVGQEIVFGDGEFAPETSRGRELMAHELTHVVQQERGAARSSPGAIRRQPKKEAPEFPDLPNLALKLEDDIGQNLFDYGHHFYRLATLYPDRPELLQEAFGRYALGANVLKTRVSDSSASIKPSQVAWLSARASFSKGLTFASKGEVVLDFQFDIGRGLKLETNFNLGVDPDDYSKVKKADVGVGVVGHF